MPPVRAHQRRSAYLIGRLPRFEGRGGSYILDGTPEMIDDSNGQAGALADEPEATEEMIAVGGALLYAMLDDAEGGPAVGKYSAQTIAKRVYEEMVGSRDRRRTHQHAPAIAES